MTRRFSSISVQTTLATGISNTALSMVCATGTASTLLGGISLTAGDVDQFKIIIDKNTASKEIMYITGVTSDTLTIQRGKDGTSAVTHSGGATIEHVLTGEDLTYFTTGVVPTSDLATGLPFPGSTSGTATLKAPAVAGTTTVTLPGATGTLATLAGTETLSNKTITGLVLSDASVVFEGATADAYETTLTVTDPTADRTITLPDSTGTVALAANVIANTLTTTTGDMIYASAANTPARLPKGNTGDVMTQGATIPGWAAPASGGGMTLLNPGGTAITNVAQISITSLSQGYKELRIYIVNAATVSTGVSLTCAFNAATTTGSSVAIGSGSATTQQFSNYNPITLNSGTGNLITAAANTNNLSCLIVIPNYADATAYKTADYSMAFLNAAGTIAAVKGSLATLAVSAIASIQLALSAGNWTAQGTIYVYGVN